MCDDWLAKDYVVELKLDQQSCSSYLDLGPKFSDKPSRPSKALVEKQLYDKLNSTKDSISTFKEWDYYSKLMNPYERISKIAKSYLKGSGSSINRAYFKIFEVIKYFNLNERTEQVTSFHMCEAPGGFIKALIDIYGKNLDWYAQSLYEGSAKLVIDNVVDIPEKWLRDGDGTGNLYNIENILAYSKKFNKKKADIVTADGGFDTQSDPNNQEQITSQLIFSEMVTALHVQNIGGSFICKIFDTVTNPTLQMFQILLRYYNKIFIMKPRNSRFSNSEKYIVCIDFKGISTEDLCELQNVVIKWNASAKKDLFYCRDFGLKKSEDPADTNDADKILYDHNIKLINNQINYIEKSIKSKKFTPEQISNIESKQNKRAFEFCYNFGIITSDQNVNKCSHAKKILLSNEKNEEQDDIISEIKMCSLCDKLIL
jgi:23S rRNA U2552 (ribose-2'-O)-methylase RlmE/FtsJ